MLGILLNLRAERLVVLVPILQGLEYTVKQERTRKVTARGSEEPEKVKSTL